MVLKGIFKITMFSLTFEHSLSFRKYIPQLRNFPEKYIYDPWNAPLEVQREAGCIIGKDYPMRIIDHEEAKLVCAKRLREMVGELQKGMSTSVS